MACFSLKKENWFWNTVKPYALAQRHEIWLGADCFRSLSGKCEQGDLLESEFPTYSLTPPTFHRGFAMTYELRMGYIIFLAPCTPPRVSQPHFRDSQQSSPHASGSVHSPLASIPALWILFCASYLHAKHQSSNQDSGPPRWSQYYRACESCLKAYSTRKGHNLLFTLPDGKVGTPAHWCKKSPSSLHPSTSLTSRRTTLYPSNCISRNQIRDPIVIVRASSMGDQILLKKAINSTVWSNDICNSACRVTLTSGWCQQVPVKHQEWYPSSGLLSHCFLLL